MVEAILDIGHWGNSLGVRLPVAIVREAHIHADQRVRMTVEDGRIVVSPIRDEKLTLKQRLALFDSKRHAGEAMVTTERVGAEKW